MTTPTVPTAPTPAIRTPADRVEAMKSEHKEARNVSDRARLARSRMTKVDGFRSKLQAKEIPGFHLCWVNDDGRVEAYLDRGYDFVENNEQGLSQSSGDTGNRVRIMAGKTEAGIALYGYLMKIPLEWWEEDQAGERAVNDKIESTIKRGGDSRANPQAKQYVPGEDLGRSEISVRVKASS